MIRPLASQMNRNDEQPNIDLAVELVRQGESARLKWLIDGCRGKDAAIASDCIKVLYEIGERDPQLLVPYAGDFMALLGSRKNRLVWGAMTALAQIVELAADDLAEQLDTILIAMEAGSVITVDQSMTVLAKLVLARPDLRLQVEPVLIRHFRQCRAKEIPQHALRVFAWLKPEEWPEIIAVLNQRKPELTTAQTARIRKLI